MAIQVWLVSGEGVDPAKPQMLGEGEDLQVELDTLRSTWMEVPEGDQVFRLADGVSGRTMAVLVRDAVDPEVCHTYGPGGLRETHRCHYVLTAAVEFDRCEVTRIG